MTLRDRDRLVVLRKAQKKQITQGQAAAELQLTERQVRRLLVRLKEVGDCAVVHGLRQRPSDRRLSEETREKAVRILSQEVYRGFGPTLASEYMAKKHKISIGREALRQVLMQAGLWRGRKQKIEEIHGWRPSRLSQETRERAARLSHASRRWKLASGNAIANGKRWKLGSLPRGKSLKRKMRKPPGWRIKTGAASKNWCWTAKPWSAAVNRTASAL